MRDSFKTRTAALCFSLLGMSFAAHAQAVVVVERAPGLSEAPVRRVQKACEEALRKTSGLVVREGPAWRRPADKKGDCGDACVEELVKAQSAPHVISLSLKEKGDRIAIDAAYWLDGKRLSSNHKDSELDDISAQVISLVGDLLPEWTRRGYGALKVETADGVVLKLDGRVDILKSGTTSTLAAGPHAVDAVYPDGRAVLLKLSVPEAERRELLSEMLQPQAPSDAMPAGVSTLRTVSYGLWAGGTVSFGFGILAGALSRFAGAGYDSCTSPGTPCRTAADAQAAAGRSQTFATVGNVLFVVGAVAAAAGAGVFAWDVVREPRP